VKLSLIIPISAGFVAIGILIRRQRHAITTFENESVLLEWHIAAHRSASDENFTTSKLPVRPS
jgi:hypothetical protein